MQSQVSTIDPLRGAIRSTGPFRRMRTSGRVVGTTARGLAIVLLGWQGAVILLAPPAYLLPAPIDVLATIVTRWSFLAYHAGLTLLEALIGLALGTGAGIAIALAVVASPLAARLAWPAILVLQSLPVFAIAPLLVLWFGFGLASKVVMATLVIFFPVASAFADGLRRTPPELVESAALLGAGERATLWRLRLPLALPALITGLRLAAPLAPLAAVIGEWVGSSAGLGFIMVQANARLQAEILFAALLVLVAMTLALRFAVDAFAARLVPWAREA